MQEYEFEDRVEVISENERTQEEEDKVRYFMSIIPSSVFNEELFSRVTMPKFSDDVEKIKWELEEIRRCKEGYKGMSGKMYFYFNYCKILNIEGGRINPEYRVADNEWFSVIEDIGKSNGEGLICVKRRRFGASWKEAADVLHDCSFKTFFKVGMNSKSERDSEELFKKVKFLYENLPQFLRVATTASNTKNFIDFSKIDKDEVGNKIKRGNHSEIIVVAPTDSAYEGRMLNKWVCDEAGKIINLPQLWSYTEDCLMQETRRIGIPVLFGTSGDVGKDGAGLVNMWENSEVYRLRRFFVGGWMGIFCDKYGNDQKEEAVRWIVYERKRRSSLTTKLYNDFLQKYPLTVEEAFSQASIGGVGDIVKINAQISRLREDPPFYQKGKFVISAENGDPEWEPTEEGDIIMYENRKPGVRYAAGVDPTDHDDTLPGASYQSMIIQSARNGMEPNKIVLDYTAKPRRATDFYNQSLLALIYYNFDKKCKALVERNRYRFIGHFDEHGQKHLLSTTPQGVTRLIGGRVNVIGINMNEDVKNYGEGLIDEEIEERSEFIPSVELLNQCIRYGTENTDKLMAWMISLILLKEINSTHRRIYSGNKRLPDWDYRKVNGIIQRIRK